MNPSNPTPLFTTRLLTVAFVVAAAFFFVLAGARLVLFSEPPSSLRKTPSHRPHPPKQPPHARTLPSPPAQRPHPQDLPQPPPTPAAIKLGGAPAHSPEKGIPLPKHLQQRQSLQSIRVGERKRLQSLQTIAEVEIPHHTLQHTGARAAGRVVRFFAEEGHHVRSGQALLEIDSPDVGKARSRYLRTHALWQLTQNEANRQKQLHKIGLNSASALAQAENRAAHAKIEYQDARAQLRIFGVQPPALDAKQLHGRYTLRAVRQGAIVHVNAKLGQWVTPDAALMQIEDRRMVWVHLRYPLQWASLIKEGDTVTFTGDGVPHALSGKIVHISENVLRAQQSLQARVDLPNPTGLLRGGQLLEAHLAPTTNTKEPPFVIPDEAIQTIGLSSVVFVLHKDHAHPRNIVTGAAFKGYTEVLFGLSEGETIVTRGAFLLKSILTQSANDKKTDNR